MLGIFYEGFQGVFKRTFCVNFLGESRILTSVVVFKIQVKIWNLAFTNNPVISLIYEDIDKR